MPLDLTGRTTRPEPETEKPRTAPRATTAGPAKPKATPAESIGTRLEKAIDRIADVLENRGNDELAEAIREDAKSMSGAIVSITRRLPPFGKTVAFILDIAEPILAFGRVLRIAFTQYREWRQSRRESEEQIVTQVHGNGTPG